MKTGFIGIGNMGGAILDSYAASEEGRADEIMICDLNEEACRAKAKRFPRVTVADSIGQLVEACHVIVVGVKPQGMAVVMEEIAHGYRSDKVIISMAAGINIGFIEDYLGKAARIVRIMPNTPAKVGEGMIALCKSQAIGEDDLTDAERVLKPAGIIRTVEEDMIDCVIGVSGSSPAYTYMYIEALIKGARANGMDPETARIFAAQSVLGAAKMVLESQDSLEQLRINVCSPGGTTIEAVNRLFENGFMDRTVEGFQAAVDRSREMTKEKNRKGKQLNRTKERREYDL